MAVPLSTDVPPVDLRALRPHLQQIEAAGSAGLQHVLAHALSLGGIGVAVCSGEAPKDPVSFCNPAFCAMMGLEKEDIIGLRHPMTALLPGLEAELQRHGSFFGQAAYTRPDGIPAWVLAAVLYVSGSREKKDEAGGAPAFVWLHQDVTPRVAAEAMWLRYEYIVNASQDLMAVIGDDFAYETVNRALSEALGCTQDGLIGKPLRQVWGGEAFNRDVLPPLRSAFRGERVRTTAWFNLPQGGRRCLDMGHSPYRDVDGAIRRVVFVARDVTAQQQAEEEVRRMNVELEERVQLRTQELERAIHDLESFSYTVAHDLRAPLRFVRTFADRAQQAAEKGEDPRRPLLLIREGIAKTNELIDGLLEFARTGRDPLERQTVDMCALAQQVFDEIAAEEQSRCIELECHDLPPAHADPVLVRQVFANLLANAVKFTRNCPHTAVQVYAEKRNGETAYCVADNGIGFDPERADGLFEVFKRLHSGEEYEGNGVGLAVVKRIAERHGGTAGAHSMPGEGATFWFTLGQ